ncbi:alpha/beta fold hydrolase [Lysinibacillus sp. SGAir0095]|uniref:alpha/beta fold hydrolase n=1 Tax=Lysinibacillus sp. SGAir0095 TaxID=2070463 RepID=UPI0010CD635A|nr:alpha/beta fold hydrolase [Lysinibacillus sp. SGAir0095]QCR31954.1 alpha/beta hydrolase [Lysinibacillus sp. SGAir0095]
MWEQHFIETSRGTFEIFKSGKGQPLCVTHLYSEYDSRGNLFANLFTEYYTVYLVNLRGCGNSTADISSYNYSMKDSVEDLEAIREALGFNKWIFAGHSTGGMLALTYAIESPTSLLHIIAGGLCASSDYMRHSNSIYCTENSNNQRIKEIFALLRNPNSTLEERRAANKEWSLMSLCSEESYEKMISRPNSGKTVSKRLDYFSHEELPSYDLRPQLPEVTLKAYVYGGRHDAQCPYEFAVETAELMPNAILKTFDYSNHFPFVEEEEEFKIFLRSTI